jgi:hypothetical protein
MLKAIINISTGEVINVIEISPDDSGGYNHWVCPEGCEMRDADNAGPGFKWNGISYDNPDLLPDARLKYLISQERIDITTLPIEEQEAAKVQKDADMIELKAVLNIKLGFSELNISELQVLYRMERG